ncbi:alpha/beta fold hydrolase [Rhodanobacter sp. Si-c]|uniref:Alpha/beta fold hydrolase n=1 Tax=Rhodanobacter lycopersici TaxID=3162487 RepID=A0ABV3QBA2_9GAMM
MKLCSIMPAVAVAAILFTPVVRAADALSPACLARATASLDAWVHGDYAGARKDFGGTLASKVDAAKLEQGRELLQDTLGAYRSHDPLQQKVLAGHVVAVSKLSFANMQLGFMAACDMQDKIVSYNFMPVEELDATAVQAHVEADGVRVLPLDVPTPVGPLRGALTLPSGSGPFPAMVLLAGSGPHDMDETVGPNKPLQDIAEGLAHAGIASLRYDKRTFDHPKSGAGLVVDAEVTDDAVAAARLLAQQKAVDPRRVFVLGHSLSAMMAPRIGQRAPQLAGLVLLGAPARSLLDVSAEQVRVLGQRDHATAAQIAAREQAIAAEQKLLAGADPRHPPAGSFASIPHAYWLSLHEYHQVVAAKALSMPMLILQGGSDFQVSPTLDFARWQQELAGRPQTTFRLYPGLSHFFMLAGKTGTAADFKVPAHVDAKVIDDIATWVKAQPAH